MFITRRDTQTRTRSNFLTEQVMFVCMQVSHDEHLISNSVDELWAVSDGIVTPFRGTFQDYKKLLHSS